MSIGIICPWGIIEIDEKREDVVQQLIYHAEFTEAKVMAGGVN